MLFSKYKLFNRYFCNNCGHWFRTGCYSKKEELECKDLYDDICPRCGAITFEWYQVFFYYFYKLFHKSAHEKKLLKNYKKHKKNS